MKYLRMRRLVILPAAVLTVFLLIMSCVQPLIGETDDTAVRVTGVTITTDEQVLQIDDTLQLTAEIAPADASEQDVTWSSGNQAVAVVNSDGLVTALGAGTTDITVTTVDGGFSDTYTLTVEPDPAISISLDLFSEEQIEFDIWGGKIRNYIEITLEPADYWDSAEWWINDLPADHVDYQSNVRMWSNNTSFDLYDAQDVLPEGVHIITVMAVKDGVPYSQSVTFTLIY